MIQKNSIAHKVIGERESQKQRVSINDDFVPIVTPNIDLDKQEESPHYESEKYTEEDHNEEEYVAQTPQVVQQATQKSEHDEDDEEDMDEDYENDYEDESKASKQEVKEEEIS
jgi:hypothetical protein